MNDETTIFFSTTDLGLAAALKVAGTPLLRLGQQNGRRISFVFPYEAATKISARYWAENLQLDALSYFNSLKTLKNHIYSGMQSRSEI